jgi:hypothetical protein
VKLGTSACVILEYLVEHPAAEDTVPGIVTWWIMERDIRRTMREVKLGLKELMKEQLVTERKGRDGQVRYRLNQRKLVVAEGIIGRDKR